MDWHEFEELLNKEDDTNDELSTTNEEDENKLVEKTKADDDDINVEFDESMLTDPQRMSIELGLSKLDDYKPKAVYGDNIDEFRLDKEMKLLNKEDDTSDELSTTNKDEENDNWIEKLFGDNDTNDEDENKLVEKTKTDDDDTNDNHTMAKIEILLNTNEPMNKEDDTKNNALVCLADVEPQETQWLWKPYIPLGKVTLMRGNPGEGKTFICLTLASIVSNGWPFPDSISCTDPANVLFVSGEDGVADTLVPRLITAKANLKRVFSINEQADPLYFKSPVFKDLIKKSEAKLVIVDPIQAFLGSDVDGHRSNEIRPIMQHVGNLASEYGCAIVILEHLNKNSQSGVNPLYRGLGSIDTTAYARSVLWVGSDPEGKKGLGQIKCNLAQMGDVIGFSISDEKGVEWNLNNGLTIDMMTGQRKPKDEKRISKLDEAKIFLKAVLADGKKCIKDIYVEAAQQTIADETLKKAKRALGVKHFKKGFGKDAVSYWRLGDCEDNEDDE